MRLVIFEDRNFHNFFPIAYLRPSFELRCGHSCLYEKIIRNHPGLPVAFFCREYLKETFSARAPRGSVVNELSILEDDLLIFNGNLLLGKFRLEAEGPDQVGLNPQGELLWARVSKETAQKLPRDSFQLSPITWRRLPSPRIQSLILWQMLREISSQDSIIGFFAGSIKR